MAICRQEIQAALEKDSVSLFNIEMMLSGKRISMDLLNGVLYFNAYSILAHLLRNRMDQVEYRLAPKDLLRHLCAKEFKTCKEEIVDIVDALEEAFPGICKQLNRFLIHADDWKVLVIRTGVDR